MKNFCFLFFLLICSSAMGQKYPLVETLITDNKVFFIGCEPIAQGIKVTIKDDKNLELANYNVFSSDSKDFVSQFIINFNASSKLSNDIQKAENGKWIDFAHKVLNNYLHALLDKLPIAGIFRVAAELPLETDYIVNGKLEKGKATANYKVESIDAEISDGYLDNLRVVILKDKRELEFILDYPVGLSSEDQINNFDKFSLHLKGTSIYTTAKADMPVFKLNLAKLLSYRPEKATGRKDYAPKDTAFNSLPGGTTLVLHKEQTSKLFEAIFYSDFKGFNEDKPNGLIQIELSKRLSVHAIQHPAPQWMYWLAKSYGAIQYITPALTISKIEQHNRQLILSDLDSIRISPGPSNTAQFGAQYHRYANALNLYQYQWGSVGTDMNIFFVNNSPNKFQVHFNTGIRFGFTSTQDSLTTITDSKITKTKFTKDYTVNTMQVYPELLVKFFPDERFNLSISQKWIYFKNLSPTVQMVSYDRDNYMVVNPKYKAWLRTLEMQMGIQVNPKSKIFGRFRMNWEMGNIRDNFSQLQIGYSTYILGK